MTSKEALERIKDDIEIGYLSTKHSNEKDKSNYLILLNSIEKDLEILEILKNNEISISYIEQSTSYDDYISKCDCFRNLSYIAEEKYTKLKEWLENDK